MAARGELAALRPLSRDERITAIAFILMGSGWILQTGSSLVTLMFLAIFLVLGMAWIRLVALYRSPCSNNATIYFETAHMPS